VNGLSEFLRSGGARRLAGATNLLLVLAIAYLLAGLTWQVIPAPPVPAPATPGQGASPVAGHSAPKTSAIAAWHLFGEPQVNAQQAQPIEAPETHLNLVLRGVLASDDQAHARAIIAEPDGNENYYAIGAALPGGAKLTRIYPDRVLLKRNGRYETLHLPREGKQDRPGGTSSRAGGSQSGESAGRILAHYRDSLARNPRSLLDLARPQPAVKNGRFVGFRLRPGQKPDLMARLGLRSGDVVTAINGVKLTSPGRGIKALRDLQGAHSVNLTVQRAGRELHLAFRVP